MRVGRRDGSTDDADVCGLRTVRHTRPEVESTCVHACGYGCLRGMNIWTRGVEKHPIPKALATMRAASPSEPSHMREGLSGWYLSLDPPVCAEGLVVLMRRLWWLLHGCICGG
jgi:hypothetical protein